MNKIFLILVTLTININLFSQEIVYFDKDWKETNKENAEYYRTFKENNNAFIINDYYKSGKLQFQAVSNTKTDSLNLQGKATWYFENGNISKRGNFINNIPNDSLFTFYSNGQIKSLAIYKSGKFDNLYAKYFPDGSIAERTYFLNGELHGTLLKYKSPGQVDYSIDYKNGKMNGKYEIYNNNGTLANKGSILNGYKEGICQDYNSKGQLTRTYTVRNKKLDGIYIEYDQDKDTVSFGQFKEGVAQLFWSHSSKMNGSIFRNRMKLLNGVEEWKIYRDDKLVIESFYKNGLYYGVWKVYNFDGTKLYETLDFTKNDQCKDFFTQPYQEEFKPFLFLSNRFGFNKILQGEKDCEDIAIVSNNMSNEDHPVYHYVEPVIKENNKAEGKENYRNIIKNYIDPSSTGAFKLKNNCSVHTQYENVSICSKEFNRISYKVFLSEDRKILEQLKKDTKPNGTEIYFYFQQIENRDYDFNKEKRPERYMGFSFSDIMTEAFKEKILDYLSIIGVLENKFWDIDNFSGLSAYSAFEKEMAK